MGKLRDGIKKHKRTPVTLCILAKLITKEKVKLPKKHMASHMNSMSGTVTPQVDVEDPIAD
ncbi:hypothetical protein [Shewanella woodyi]|uniref:hypothetical protein n=1 Tax=Shewanella woodyi TaxID=60961 RepID=UPI0007EACE99|nr:hypothetical protein [Shewanella woodyi]